MATSLPRPGVRVQRTTTATTPQAVVPTLRPWVVGPAYDVMELYSGTSLNNKAILTAPARIVGVGVLGKDITALRGASLTLSINNKAPTTVKLPINLSSKPYLLDLLNSGFTDAYFSLVSIDDDRAFLSIQTIALGDTASIEIKDGTANAVLGFVEGDKQRGVSNYTNQKLSAPLNAFPTMRDNIKHLHFDSLEHEVKAYYKQSGLVYDYSRDQTVLRNHIRNEYGVREPNGSLTPYGFSFLSPPEDDVGTGWDFDITGGHSQATQMSRKLVPEDDGDGDSRTALIKSPGGRASTSVEFNKPAWMLANIGVGATAGMLHLATNNTYLPGYLGNFLRYRAVPVNPVVGPVEVTDGNSTSITCTGAGFTNKVAVGDMVVLGATDTTPNPSTAPYHNYEVVRVTAIYSNDTLRVTRIHNTRNIFGGGNTTISVFPANFDAIVVSGGGTQANPWVVTQRFGVGTPAHVVLHHLLATVSEDESVAPVSVILPESAERIGRQVSVADALSTSSVVFGPEAITDEPGSGVVMSSVPATAFTGGKTSRVITEAKDARYGALGNFVSQTYTANEVEVKWNSGGGDGQNPNDILAKEFKFTTASAATLSFDDDLHLVANSTYANPWAGKSGDNISVEFVDQGASTDLGVTVTAVSSDIRVVVSFDSTNGDHKFSAVETLINNDPVASQFVVATGGSSNPLVAAPATNLTNGTDATPVSDVIALAVADADVTVRLDTSNTLYSASCPLEDFGAKKLTGGWDPINFREQQLLPSNMFNHGEVTGARNLADAIHYGALDIAGKSITVRVNGGADRSIMFQAGDETDLEYIVDRINGEYNTNFGSPVAQIVDGKYLRISAIQVTADAGDMGRPGLDSRVEILGGTDDALQQLFAASSTGTATPDFYEASSAYTGLFTGGPMAAMEGDTLVDYGVNIGNIIGFKDLSIGSRQFKDAILVLDTEVSLLAEFNGWYVLAKHIDYEADNKLVPNYRRPLPDFYVDALNKLAIVKGGVAIDVTGVPLRSDAVFPMYVTYRALRSDLARGVSIRSETDLELVTPLTAENPLGLALQLAWQAGEGIMVSGVGLPPVFNRDGTVAAPAVSRGEPYGTQRAYDAIKPFLATQDVYTLTPLTPAEAVLKAFRQHVLTMSSPDRKQEQVLLACPTLPTHVTSRVVVSGTASAVVGSDNKVFIDPSSASVLAAMADIINPETGVTAPLTTAQLQSSELLWDRKLYLNISSDTKNYLVKEINGNEITVWADDTFFNTHEGNEDGFYATTALSAMRLDGEPVSLLQRGRLLDSAEEQATAMADQASSYDSYRVRVIGPDWCEVPISGIATRVESHFMGAIAGARICGKHPRFPLSGDTIPVVSNVTLPDGFTDYEQGVAAYGGYSLALFEDNVARWRDFVTTDNSTIENFEHSMLTPDDVAARLIRQELRAYVGPLAIDRDYFNRIGMILDALVKRLVQEDIYASCTVESIAVDEDDPRQLIVKLARSVFYPARGILVVLV